MARLRLEIPDLSDEDVQRLIAALAGVVPGVDLKIEVETDMAKAAVKTKARRETLTAKAASGRTGRPKLDDTQKLKFRSVGLEPDLWTWIEGSAAAHQMTPNQFVRGLIVRARAATL